MYLFSGLKRGACLVLFGCAMIYVYGGGNELSFMRPPSVELEVRGLFDDDEEDFLVFRATEGVFRRVADHVILGEYDNVRQQGRML